MKTCNSISISRFAWKTEREANTFAALNLLKGEDIYDQNIIGVADQQGCT